MIDLFDYEYEDRPFSPEYIGLKCSEHNKNWIYLEHYDISLQFQTEKNYYCACLIAPLVDEFNAINFIEQIINSPQYKNLKYNE